MREAVLVLTKEKLQQTLGVFLATPREIGAS